VRKATMLKEEDHQKEDNQDLEEGSRTQGGGSLRSGRTRLGKGGKAQGNDHWEGDDQD